MANAQSPANPPARLLDDTILRFLPSPLREPRRPLLALAVGAVLTLTGSILLAMLVQSVAPGLASPPPPPPNMPAWLIVFAYIVFAPVVESIAMAIALVIMLRWLGPATAIMISAAGWAILHSQVASAWGLTIWWPFVVFSTLFVVWRTRGFWAGLGMAIAAHMLQNLGPGLLIAFR